MLLHFTRGETWRSKKISSCRRRRRCCCCCDVLHFAHVAFDGKLSNHFWTLSKSMTLRTSQTFFVHSGSLRDFFVSSCSCRAIEWDLFSSSAIFLQLLFFADFFKAIPLTTKEGRKDGGKERKEARFLLEWKQKKMFRTGCYEIVSKWGIFQGLEILTFPSWVHKIWVWFWPELVQRKRKKCHFFTKCTNYW